VAADVLEHLVDPWTTLKQSVALLEPGATVVVSLPNVFYWKTLLRAIASRRWPRDHEGIFDRTHIRWFGARDAADLLAGAGLTSVVVRPNYWALKRWLFLVRALGRTPIRDFLGGQHLATGIVPG
jgi:hypothetical protein